MTNSNSKSGPKPPDSPDPLSATGMFLRAFEQDTRNDAAPEDSFGFEPARPASTPVPPAASSAPAVGAAPGEFTQLFNTIGQRPAPAVPVNPPPPQASTQPAKGSPHPPPAEHSSGEFTRIFVSGVTPPTPSVRPAQETPRPVPPPSASAAKSEGSFTQFFSTNAAARPLAPAPLPGPPRPAAAASPAVDDSWKNDPFFHPADKKSSIPEAPSSSVTGILSSLAGSGAGTATPRAPEPAPYRPEPLGSYAPPKQAPEEPGGVTRLIQRLQEPAPAAPPRPTAPAAPPPDSGPGEFTRIIQGLGPRPAAPPPAAPPPAAPVFAVAPPAIPAIPHVAPPAISPAPHMPAAHAPAPAPAPVFAAPVVPLPPMPKPPALPVPALAPPKSKLEAMVPILLVINTFLLVLLLVVVIFLIKGK